VNFVNRKFQPPRAVEPAIEQIWRVGAAALGELIGPNPDQSKPRNAIGFGGEQARSGLEKRVGQLGWIDDAARARSQAKNGGLELQRDRARRQRGLLQARRYALTKRP